MAQGMTLETRLRLAQNSSHPHVTLGLRNGSTFKGEMLPCAVEGFVHIRFERDELNEYGQRVRWMKTEKVETLIRIDSIDSITYVLE